MKYSKEVLCLTFSFLWIFGSREGLCQVQRGDKENESDGASGVSPLVAGRLTVPDLVEARAVDAADGIAVHVSQSPGMRLFAVVGSGYASVEHPSFREPGREGWESESLTKDGNTVLPTDYALHQNYPNPFNPSTTIRFDLPEDSRVTITVYDVLGRSVYMVINENVAGFHTQQWNGQTAQGTPAASGVYFCRLEARSLVSQRSMTSIIKMVMMK